MKYIFWILLIPVVALSQIHGFRINPLAGKPRTKNNADSNGHYEVVALLNKTQIDKGDSAIIDVFITGYGQILQPKLFISSSASDIFAPSYILNSPILKDSNFSWGGNRVDFETPPVLMVMNGGFSFELNGKEEFFGQFIDADKHPLSTYIITEGKLNHTPVEIHLHFKEKIRADNYKLNLYLTYYNGQEWVTSIGSVDFRINNVIQTHEDLFGIIALIAAIVGILPGIQLAYHQIKKIQFRRPWATKKKRDLTPKRK